MHRRRITTTSRRISERSNMPLIPGMRGKSLCVERKEGAAMGFEFQMRWARYMLRCYPYLSPREDGIRQAESYIDMMVNGYPHQYEDVHAVVRRYALEKCALLAKAE